MKTASALSGSLAIITLVALLFGLSLPIGAFAGTRPLPQVLKNKPNAVLRTIPGSLKWSCIPRGSGEYKCTDPKTGKAYLCTGADDSGDRVCDVGDDKIEGSRP
jgi:hypothetical protein